MVKKAIDGFALGIILGVLMGILGNLWVSYWLLLYPPSIELAPWLLAAATIILLIASYLVTRQHRIEVEKLLKQGEILETLMGADIRSRDDKRGRIFKKEDGTYAVNWTVNLSETLTVSGKVGKKKKEKQKEEEK